MQSVICSLACQYLNVDTESFTQLYKNMFSKILLQLKFKLL